VDSGPPATTTNTSATFTFSADEAGSTFECSLNGAAFTGCTSPEEYSGLSVGAHTFEVRATDAAGNVDATPAGYDWTVEAPAPVCDASTITVNADSDAWIEQNSPSNNKGDDSVLKVKSQGSTDNFRAMVDFPFPTMPEGCQVGTATLRVYSDSAASGRTIQALRFTASWTESGVTWSNQPATTGVAATTTSGTGYREWTVTTQVQAMYDESALYGFLLRDATENGSGAEQQFFSREKGENPPQLVVSFVEADTTPPVTSLTVTPDEGTTDTTATFEFGSDEAYSSYECALDGVAFTTCTTPKTYTGLAVGEHTFEVRAIDTAGNVDATPASFTWMVEPDVTAPDTTIDDGPEASSTATSATFEFSSSESGSTFECSLDGGSFSTCNSPKTYSALAVGSHTVEVRAVDAAGNVDATPASYTWTVETPPADTTPPETTIDSGPAATTTATGATFTFSSSETGSTFECSLDGGAYAACTSPKTYSGLAAASHTFSVRAIDAAGNVDASPASTTWTITAAVDCGSTVTLTANADAWLEQNSSSSNKGTDSDLKVKAQGSTDNFRAVVRFAFPTLPAGCEVETATLRMYASSAKTGRTLQALRLTATWTETGVTWANQPATSGAAATTSSGKNWREWNVATQVQAMYDAAGLHGFLIRDSVESGGGAEQTFNSREKSSNRPTLILTFGPSGG
jgi:hypothetical protein